MTDYKTAIPLEQLQDIVSTMMYAAEADSLREALQRIAHASRELIGARYAALGIPDGKGGLRFFEVSGVSDKEIARIPHAPHGEGLLGVIMNEQETLRLDHMDDDPRTVGFPEGHPQMDSFLGVPVRVGSQLFGMLYLSDREDGMPFSVYDEWLLETMAGYAALAIAGSQLRDQQRRLTLLEERQRIGMELHDGVIQSLYAVGMLLDMLRSNANTKPDDFQPVIDGLNEVIEDIRAYINDLKTGHGEKTIYRSLNDMMARLYVPEHLNLTIEAPDTLPPFPAEDFESICLIAREALSNAIRHADASNVHIRAWLDSSNFQMIVRDDGCGFSPEGLHHKTGLGLRNIQERVRLHGGVLVINSKLEQGTAVMVTIPIRRSRRD